MKRSLESLSLQMWQRSSEQTPLKQQSHSWRQETGSWLVPTILDRGGTVYNRVVKLQASRSCFLLVFQKSCGTNHCPQSIRLSLSAICFVLNVPFMLTTIPSLNWWAGHLTTHDSTIGLFSSPKQSWISLLLICRLSSTSFTAPTTLGQTNSSNVLFLQPSSSSNAFSFSAANNRNKFQTIFKLWSLTSISLFG